MCGNGPSRFSRTETKYFVGATEIPASQVKEIPQTLYARLFPNRTDGFAKTGLKRIPLDDRALRSDAEWKAGWEREARNAVAGDKFLKGIARDVEAAGGVDAWVAKKMASLRSEGWDNPVQSTKMLIATGGTPQAIDRIVKWERKERQTMCGAKCRGARGPNCDCVCEGKFHGAGVAMSRARFAASEIDLKPTAEMASNAERGLALRERHGKGGTAVGVARARDIKNRANLSPETVKRMHSFFSRHAGNEEGGENDAGYISFLLWGGAAGKAWAARKVEQIDKTSSARMGRNSNMAVRKRSRERFAVAETVVHDFHDGWVVVSSHDGYTGGTKLVLRNTKDRKVQPQIVKSIAEAKTVHEHQTAWLHSMVVEPDARSGGFLIRVPAHPGGGGYAMGGRGGTPFKTRALAEEAIKKIVAKGGFMRASKNGAKARMEKPLRIGAEVAVEYKGDTVRGQITRLVSDNPPVYMVSIRSKNVAVKRSASEIKQHFPRTDWLGNVMSRPGAKARHSAANAWTAKYLAPLNQWWRERTDHPTTLTASSSRWEIEGVLDDVAEHCREAPEPKPSWYAAAVRDAKKLPMSRPGVKTTNKDPNMNRIEMTRPGAKDAYALGEAASAAGIDRPEHDEALRDLVKKVGGEETVRLFARWDEGRKAAVEKLAMSRPGAKARFAHWTETTRVVESMSYENIHTGKTVSGGGAVPWTTEAGKADWKPVRYFVFMDAAHGTTFGGRYNTQAQAQAALDKAKRDHAAEVAKYETAPAIRKRIGEIEGELAGLENSPSMAGRVPRMDRLNAELKRLREQLRSLGFSRPGAKAAFAARIIKAQGHRFKITDEGEGYKKIYVEDAAEPGGWLFLRRVWPEVDAERLIESGAEPGPVHKWAHRFARPGGKARMEASYEAVNQLYDRVMPIITDMNQFVSLSIPRVKGTLDEAAKYAKKAAAFGEKILKERVASPEMLRELDRMASVVRAQYGYRITQRGANFFRPGAKARFNAGMEQKLLDLTRRFGFKPSRVVVRSTLGTVIFEDQPGEADRLVQKLKPAMGQMGIPASAIKAREISHPAEEGLPASHVGVVEIDYATLAKVKSSRPGARAAFANWTTERTKKNGNPITEYTATLKGGSFLIEKPDAMGTDATLYLWNDLRGLERIATGDVPTLKARAESMGKREAKGVANVERIANYSRLA